MSFAFRFSAKIQKEKFPKVVECGHTFVIPFMDVEEVRLVDAYNQVIANYLLLHFASFFFFSLFN